MEYKIIRSNDSLMHYGVIGMKWGVRRYQNPDGTLTEAGKRRQRKEYKGNQKINDPRIKKIIIAGSIVAVSALALYGGYKIATKTKPNYLGAYKYGKNILLKDTIKEYSDKSLSIKSGKVLQRISRSMDADYIDKGHTYVSYFFNDKMHYKIGLPKELIWKNNNAYVHKIKTNKNLKIPSTRDVAKIYSNLFPNDKDNIFRQVITRGFINEDIKDDPAMNAIRKKTEVFKKELLKNGYHAIFDIEDAGNRIAPLIILDTSVFESDKTHKLGKVETIIAKILN